MFIGLTYGTGEYGCQYSPAVSAERTLPQNAPAVPDALLVGPENALVQNYTPMGIRLDAPQGDHTTVRIRPVRHGLMYISGVRSFNAPGEVEIVRVVVGNGGDIARNASPFDAAAYQTQRCFCPVDWGCANRIVLTVRGLVPNARLNWVVFGTYEQAWNSCYTSAGTVEAHAAALWGMVNGRDANDRGTLEAWRAARNANGGAPRSSAGKTLASRLKAHLRAA